MEREPDAQRPREAETIADMDSDPGDAKRLSTIGRYVILDSVGMGGMGLVCAAYDPKLNRRIALKLLRNASSDEASTAGRNRLFREAQALARLSHPNVVTVHDVDVFEGQVYIAMEFVEGMTLREWLRKEERSWKEVLEKFILAGRGLAAAHQADIIHRDFKPSNVLISKEGEVRVADFGVAKERDRPERDVEGERAEFENRRRTAGASHAEDTATAQDALIEEIQSNYSLELTVAGRMVGTPAYMAPEQHMGLHVGPATDQYSFCVSLYEALYDRLPFEGTDRRDQLAKMAEGKLPPVPKEGPAGHVPGWLHKILARGLRPHPSERWPSMEALLAALERDPIKRLRRVAVIGVGVLGLVAGAIGIAVDFGPEEEVNLCPATRDEILEHWNEERRAEIDQVFRISSKPFANDASRRTSQTLDRWAEQWATSREAICEATRVGQQSQQLLDVRMLCLDHRALELDAMVNLFLEADDEIVERSVSAAHSLIDPRICETVQDTRDVDEQAAQDPVTLEQIRAMEADLNRAFALASADKFDESLPLQARVVARAREGAHQRILARALYDLGESQVETGDVKGGEASLREAIELSAKLGDGELEARAWLRLIFLIARQPDRYEDGKAWSLAASSALARAGAGASPKLAVVYESTLGALELSEEKLAEAVERYDEALELAREVYGEDHPVTINMMMNYGVSLARHDPDRVDEALDPLLEAVSRSREVFGGSHPTLARVYLNLGSVYFVGQKFDKAEAAFREALDIRERIWGLDAPTLANPLQMLAKIEGIRGRHEEALHELERVRAIHAQVKGEASPEVAGVLTDIAVLQQRLGRYAEARMTFEEVADLYATIYPDSHLHIGGFEKRRCKFFIEAQLWAEAVAACERALAIDEQFGAKNSIQIQVLELLAEGERGRGRSLAAERVQERIAELERELEAEETKKNEKKAAGED
jgi:serine/threonine protein kinase